MKMKSTHDAISAIARPGRATAVVLLAAIVLGGCAFTTGHVNLSYDSSGNATKIADSNSTKVAVEVLDKRPSQVVGDKMNGYGMKGGDIVSDSDVPATVKSAVETELTNRGFTLGPNGNLVEIRLSELHNQYSLGVISSDSTATMGMEVSVKRADGTIAYNKYFTGRYVLTWVEYMGADNTQKALNEAMKDSISKLFSDTGFTNSLIQSSPAGAPSPVPAGS